MYACRICTQRRVIVTIQQQNRFSSAACPKLGLFWSNPRLFGLGLFCGGGNFDRGLEDGGAVQVKYAVDWDAAALHSYRVNVKDPKDVEYFLGSVNDHLSKVLFGSQGARIARIGSIECISAGSPCPGFSTLQKNK